MGETTPQRPSPRCAVLKKKKKKKKVGAVWKSTFITQSSRDLGERSVVYSQLSAGKYDGPSDFGGMIGINFFELTRTKQKDSFGHALVVKAAGWRVIGKRSHRLRAKNRDRDRSRQPK